MPELRQQFKTSTIENLELLQQKVSSAKEFPDIFIQEIFRQIHTIKGTAQTFGFERSGIIAHELESILSSVKNKQNTLSKKLLLESIETLRNSFTENASESSDDLINKLKAAASSKTTSELILPDLPENILTSLSISETETLSAAFGNGKIIYCLEIYFALANFREKLLKFREILEQNGEIIAALSAAKKDVFLGFRFLFASEIKFENAEDFSPKIIFETSLSKNNLPQVIEKIKTHGENLANKLGKQIEFKISTIETSLSDNQTKIIFDVLLHLIKNAVDHAIEMPVERRTNDKTEAGKIEIKFSRDSEKLKITIADDGKGIDPEKIRSKAIENKLISKNKDLDKQEMLNLIFLAGISTAENLNEVSGRGIGLNAVKEIIESAGGTVKVESQKEIGTTFEIILPLNV